MIKNTYMSNDNLYKDAQKGNRYENIHKNFVQPQNNYYPEAYQNQYSQKDVNYNGAKVQQPNTINEYKQAYKSIEHFSGKPQIIRQQNNIKLSTEPFNSYSQYTSQLRGQLLNSKTQRHYAPINQIFPKGHFQGTSAYNNSYIKNNAVHRQPQFRPQGQIKIGQGKFQGHSSYLNDYAAKMQTIKPQKIIQKNNDIMPRGDFVGQSTYGNAYVQSKIEKNQKMVPISELKVGGTFEGSSSYLNDFSSKHADRVQKYVQPKNQTLPRGKFEGQSNYNDSYIGTQAIKQKQFRPQEEWKMEGEFQGNSSYLNDYKKYQNAQKSRVTPLPNNKFMPEGQFQSTSSYQNSYLPNVAVREKQFRPEGELKIGGQHFEGNTSYGNDYAEKGHIVMTEKFRPKQNNIMPVGKFQAQSNYNANYIQNKIQKGQSFKPKHELQVGGKFEGQSNYTQQYSEKKGIRAQRYQQPLNQVMPEGRFEGGSAYTDSYIPSAIQRTQKVIMKPQLTVGDSRFEGNSHYAQNYQFSPVKKQVSYEQQQYLQQRNSQPKWNKKTSRWQ